MHSRLLRSTCLIIGIWLCACSSQTNFEFFNLSGSSLSASPDVLIADGVHQSDVRLTLMETAHQGFGGASIVFASDGDARITPATGVTDAGGTLTASLTTRTPGTIRVSATLHAQGKVLSLPLTAEVQAVASTYTGNLTLAQSAIKAGDSVNATFTVLDDQNAPVEDFSGAFAMASSDTRATLPATFTMTPQDHGTTVLPVTLRTAGRQTLRITALPDKRAAQAVASFVAEIDITLTVSHADAFRIDFVREPADVHVHTVFALPPEVSLTDAYGNAVSGNTAVTLALQSNPNDAQLEHVMQTAGGDGNVAFSASVNAAVDGATLVATRDALSATSAPFDVLLALGGQAVGLPQHANVVLQNGNDSVALTSDGPFVFPAFLHRGESYSAVLQSGPAGCVLYQGLGVGGTQDVNNLLVQCPVDGHKLGGNVSGLVTGNVLLVNAVNFDTVASANANFTFDANIPTGQSYSIAAQPPPGQACVVANGNGVMPATDVNDVAVTCAPLAYTLGGTVAGLAGGNVTLINANDNDTLSVASGSFTFPTTVPYGGNYNVVAASPAGYTCSVTQGQGVMPAASVANVAVTCAAVRYHLGGTVSGLVTGNVTLIDAARSDTKLAPNGVYVFDQTVAYGANYNVTLMQPPGQTCAVSRGTGTMPAADVNNVDVACAALIYPLGGQVVGLLANTNVAVQNGPDTVSTANGNFVFPTGVAYGGTFAASLSQPTGQTCGFSGNSNTGWMPAGSDTNIRIVCMPDSYSVGGAVMGLFGGNVVLNNAANGDSIEVPGGPFVFDQLQTYSSNYNVTVTQAPAGYDCLVNSGQGTVPDQNVTTISVQCSTDGYRLGGTVSGLVSGNVTLVNSANLDGLSVGNGAYVFNANVPFNANYQVSVTAPPGRTCTVANGNGVMPAANVTNVDISCVTNAYTLGGQVTGLLSNTNLTLQNSGDTVSAGNGNFVFPTAVAFGSGFAAHLSQPPGQTCVFVGNSNAGTMPAANDANIRVNCSTNAYTLGGQVSGLLSNTNVTLSDGNDALSVTNAAYTFPTPLPFQRAYAVSITNPTGQTCGFVPGGVGSGTMATAPVTNANVACTTNSYTLGGTVTGLSGGNVTLTNLNNNDTSITPSGSFTFPTPVPYIGNYNIVATSPAGYTCTVANAQGSMPAANVTNVAVTCSAIGYHIGGTISGLVTGNVTLTNLPPNDIKSAPNGAYTFSQAVAFGSNYNVTLAQPTGQTCTISNGNGVMPAADVTNVNISCSALTYTLGGQVAGLLPSTSVSLVNGADTLAAANGNFVFPTAVAYNSSFAASLTQPTGQTCAFVANSNTGTMPPGNDSNIRVNCTTNAYSLGGRITGLMSNTNVTLNDGNDILTPGNGAYVFPTLLPYQSAYTVAITSPTGQTCAFVPGGVGSGTMGSAAVTNANVACTTNNYTLGGTVTGLSGGNVTLTNLNNNDTSITPSGSFTFPTPIPYTGNYNIVATSPSGYTCTVANAQGSMPAANVTNVAVTCSAVGYHISGTISGLVTGNVTLTNLPPNDIKSAPNGAYTFSQAVPFGSNYNVTLAQPAGQTCTISNGNGVMPAADVTNVDISCAALTYTLGGQVAGLLSSTSVSLANGADTVAAANGNFIFPTAVAYNSTFATSLTQPTGQTCAFVANSNTGTMPPSNDSNIRVNCTTNAYSLGGRITGLMSNTNVTLNDVNDILAPGNGAYVFPTLLPYQRAYTIAITNPTGQTCAFVPGGVGSGTMGSAAVTNANLACTTNSYTLGGTVTGLSGGNVTLTNLNNNDTSITPSGSFTFPTQVAYTGNYNVVATSPAGYTCTVANAQGSMPATNVTNVAVTCSAVGYHISGTISGLITGNVTLTNLPPNDIKSAPNGAYTFSQAVPFGSNYNVTLAQPAGQTCTISNGNGVMPAADVTNVNISCVALTYTLGGQVAGLLSSTSVSLSNGADTVAAANGNFVFPTAVAYNSTFAASLTQPTGQTCGFVANSNTGSMPPSNDSNIRVSCSTNSYSLGGRVAGLMSNTNVTLNDGNDILTPGNGAYVFPTLLPYQRAYTVAITNPTGQTCAFVPGGVGSGTMGSAAVTNANVACTTNSYTLGGTVTGLSGGNVTLTNANNNDVLTTPSGSFTFPTQVPYTGNYNIVATSPAGYTCTVANAQGSMPAANVTNVAVTCSAIGYHIGGTISGLVTGSVTLTNLPPNDIKSAPNGAYTFSQAVAFGSNYNVTLAQPTGQTCTISNSNGVMPAADVTNVNISCSALTYTLGGQVAGLLSSTSVSLANGADTVAAANGNFVFPTAVAYNSTFAASLTPPTGQTCAFVANSNTGTMPPGNDSNIRVSCSTNSYSLGGRVTGLMSNTNVTLNDGNDILTPGNGAYVFPTLLPYQRVYTVAISNPTGQTCAFVPSGAGSATMGAASVSNANVACTTNSYTVGGTVTGLAGGNIVITNLNNNDTLSVPAGSFTFATPVAYAGNYNIVAVSPAGYTCTTTHAQGSMPAANVTNVAVSCTANTYHLGGTVTGLVTGNVTLTNVPLSDVRSASNGAYTFSQTVTYGAGYNVTLTQPTGQTCAVANANGLMPASDVTNVNVSCTANSYYPGGAITGLLTNTNATVTNNGVSNAVGNGNWLSGGPVAYASSYAFSLTSPTGQSCSFVSNSNTGTMPAYNPYAVHIACTTNTYTVGGAVAGLVAGQGSVLNTVNGDTVTSGNGNYVLPTAVAYGSNYNVTVTAPAGQTCIVTQGSGTMPAGNITNANALCAPKPYTLGGVVSGALSGGNQVTVHNGADAVASSNGNFTFATQVPYQSSYSASLTSPTGYVCAFTGNSNTGTMPAANVFPVAINCNVSVVTPAHYSVGGTVSGLSAGQTITLTNTGNGDAVSTAAGSYMFPTSLSNGAAYQVTLTADANQNCSLSGSTSGTISNANVTNVNVACAQNVSIGTNPSGSVAIGSPNFTSSSGGASANALDHPRGRGFLAPNGVLYIADTNNNRIVGFSPNPSGNNATASFTLGQGGSFTTRTAGSTASTFNGPVSVTGDASHLIVSDQNNHRVLIWNSLPTSQANPNVVLGQSSFTGNSSACTATGLNSPAGVFYSGSVLLIADTANNRVLVYNAIPVANAQSPNFVQGQTSFTACSANKGLPQPSGLTLSGPTDAYTDGTILLITDAANNRATMWPTFPTSNGAPASKLFGQTTFTGRTATLSSSGLSNPGAVIGDGTNLFIADSGNNRVMIWNAVPTSNNTAANAVVGQSSFTAGSCNAGGAESATTLCNPMGVFLDGAALGISDTNNNRVTIYSSN